MIVCSYGTVGTSASHNSEFLVSALTVGTEVSLPIARIARIESKVDELRKAVEDIKKYLTV